MWNVELNIIIKYKYCDCFLEYTDVKDYLIEHKCLSCNKKVKRTIF